MKCLPEDRLGIANGNVLHDSHAEILAVRAFNRFLLDECARLVRGSGVTHASTFLSLVVEGQTTTSTPEMSFVEAVPPWSHTHIHFRIKDSTRIHMYCSEAPCGDASMELIMSQQEDPTPWDMPVTRSESGESAALQGRGYFGELGVVRRKPSRPDAPQAHSKSCSDKLAMRQFTSLLCGLTTLLIDPSNAYIDTIVLPTSEVVPAAWQRAFGPEGRLRSAHVVDAERLQDYHFRPFKVSTTSLDFQYSRRASPSLVCVPSNLAAIAYGSKQECLINGVLQGRKQTDPKGGSALSRRAILQSVVELMQTIGEQDRAKHVGRSTYAHIKGSQSLALRASIKQKVRENALKGWERNSKDENWSL